MKWTDIQLYWPELKRSLRADHPDLDTEELERTVEGRLRLLDLIEAKYSSSRPAANDDFEALKTRRGSDPARSNR